MSGPLAYRASCVPLALSVLLDRPVEEVAAHLWRAGAAREVAPGSPAGQVRLGTDPHRAADVALRLGHRLQLWNPDGRMFLSAPEYEHFLRSLAQRSATTVERSGPAVDRTPAPEEAVQRLEGDPAPSEPPEILTVRAWRSRFPCGAWLLVVRMVDGSTHALALQDGEITAGGEEHRDHQVVQALRVLPPLNSKE